MGRIGQRRLPDHGSHDRAGIRTDIQGLRAVAVIFVVAYHAGLPLPGGFTGVDMFFVISGFVITVVLLRELTATGGVRLSQFYARRFKRLIPALALVIVTTVLLSILLLSPLGPQEATAKTGLGAIFLMANVVIARTTGDYFDATPESNALLHTWSLSVEEQFYLVFPVLLLLCFRLLRDHRWIVSLIGVATLGSGLLALADSRGRLPAWFPETLAGFYGPATRAWEFGVGALLAVVTVSMRSDRQRWVIGHRMLALLGVALIAASGALISSELAFPSEWTVLPVAGTALLIAYGRSVGPLDRVLSSRSMVWIGDRSYSIYLWHWPFVVFAAASMPGSRSALAVAAILSIAPAVASFRWVEEPLRRAPVPSDRTFVRYAVATAISVGLVTGSVAMAAAHSYGSARLQVLQAATEEITEGCHNAGVLTADTRDDCTWNAEGRGAPVYLVGDSHALHLSAGVIDAGTSSGRPVVVTTAPNCPILDIRVAMDETPAPEGECEDFAEGTMAFLDEADPGTVIWGASDLYWWDPSIQVGPALDTLTREPETKLDVAERALAAAVQRFTEAGHTVMLVQDVPRWTGPDYWDASQCTGWMLIRDDMTCRRTMPIDRVQARQGAVRPVLDTLAQGTDATVLDTWPVVCPDGLCATWRGEMTTYRDSNHISAEQSHALTDVFVEALNQECADCHEDGQEASR